MRTLVTILVFLSFIGAMFVSLTETPTPSHGTSHSATTHTSTHCPFMLHEETLCTMSLLSHIDAWRIAFQTVTDVSVLVLFIIGIALLPPSFFLTARDKIPIFLRALHAKEYRFAHRPLQELFSSGILHPKLF